MELVEAIKTRCSIRKYQSTPVDDRTVESVLDAARLAPSWANTQCWRFIVVRDSQIKTKLAETLIPHSGDVNPASQSIKDAPVLIVACAQLGRSGYTSAYDKPATDKGEYWYMFDVALAMHNLSLVAHSLGLGTIHVGLFNAKKVARILKVPAGFCVVEMMPLGYPAEKLRVRPRKELAELAFHERFGLK